MAISGVIPTLSPIMIVRHLRQWDRDILRFGGNSQGRASGDTSRNDGIRRFPMPLWVDPIHPDSQISSVCQSAADKTVEEITPTWNVEFTAFGGRDRLSYRRISVLSVELGAFSDFRQR
jgi:hypothetical protein